MRTAAVTTIPEDRIVVLGLAEGPSGEGGAFLIQFADDAGASGPGPGGEADEDFADEFSTYCMTNELGYSFYGGIESIQIDPNRHRIAFDLTAEASEVLGIPQRSEFTLNTPRDQEISFYSAVERLFPQYGTNVTVENG